MSAAIQLSRCDIMDSMQQPIHSRAIAHARAAAAAAAPAA